MVSPLLELRDLSLRLGVFEVRDVTLELQEGDYFVLLGPTGAGKSVLLECIAGLLRARRGSVLLEGVCIDALPPERRRMAYLPQDYALFPHLDVAGNIAFGMRLRRHTRAQIAAKVAELASLLGITHLLERSPVKLSGGEQQRVALARALAIEPRVLLLDEPLSALDERMREQLAVELRRLHEQLGTTTIHVSHSFEETLALADRVGVIHQGRLRQVGTPQDVFRRPASAFVAEFVRSENILAGRARREGGGLRVRVGGLEVRVADGPEGEVLLVVRPEDVLLSPGVAGPEGDGQAGRVVQVLDRAAVVKVVVRLGEHSLVALMGRREAQRSALRPGDSVTVRLEPGAVHLLPRP